MIQASEKIRERIEMVWAYKEHTVKRELMTTDKPGRKEERKDDQRPGGKMSVKEP